MTSPNEHPRAGARDRALRRLSGLKRLAAAGSVALVVGFSALSAHASTASQSTNQRATVAASDGGRSQTTSRHSSTGGSSSDSSVGSSSSGSDSSSSSSSAASAPAQTSQAPAVVSGGS